MAIRQSLVPTSGLLLHHIASTVVWIGQHEHDNQPGSAFLGGICHHDLRPKRHETVSVRIKLIAAGLQFTKDERAITTSSNTRGSPSGSREVLEAETTVSGTVFICVAPKPNLDFRRGYCRD